MKGLGSILVALGLLLLIAAAAGRFIGHPNIVSGVRVVSIVILANTAFLLAIITRLFEKK